MFFVGSLCLDEIARPRAYFAIINLPPICGTRVPHHNAENGTSANHDARGTIILLVARMGRRHTEAVRADWEQNREIRGEGGQGQGVKQAIRPVMCVMQSDLCDMESAFRVCRMAFETEAGIVFLSHDIFIRYGAENRWPVNTCPWAIYLRLGR